MRNQIAIALVSAFLLPFVACSSETVAPPPRPPVGSLEPVAEKAQSKDVVTNKERALPGLYAQALSSQSSPGGGAPFAGVIPLLNPDLAEFMTPGIPPAHEPEGIVAAHATLFGAFDDRKMTLTRVWRTPNEQSIEWVMTGKHARAWMGVAPTGKAVAFKGLTLLWTKDDGTLVDIHVYFDSGLLKAQLGGDGPKELVAMPMPPAPSGDPQVIEEPSASSEDSPNIRVVKGWLDALETNKDVAYGAAMADGATIDTLESATPMKSPDDLRGYYRGVHKAIGQLDTTVNNAWSAGTYAIVEYDLDGEQLSAYSWIPLLAHQPSRSARLAHFDLVDVCEIRDGKIGHIWRYDSPAQMLEAGASPDAGRR
jgi:hypothetical protein